MIVVQPPFTRYKDLKIELDPNNLMTFPMNVSAFFPFLVVIIFNYYRSNTEHIR